jgi:hypothetical protein
MEEPKRGFALLVQILEMVQAPYPYLALQVELAIEAILSYQHWHATISPVCKGSYNSVRRYC